MLRNRWSLALAVVGAALASVVGTTSAQAADTQGTAACLISGSAKAGVQWSGGSGGFTFNNLELLCAGVIQDPVAPTGTVDVVQVNTVSPGTFSNTVCGTGTADGVNPTSFSATSLITGGASDGTRTLTNIWNGTVGSGGLGYHIDFIAGIGTLDWTNPALHPVTQVPPVNTDGVITITAELPPSGVAPPPLTNHCTEGFTVLGEVHATTNNVAGLP